jgi:ATP-dependent Clp protease ATP-binding subunit ClpA
VPLPLERYLGGLLTEQGGYKLVVSYTPLQGFSVLNGEKETYEQLTKRSITENTPLLTTAAQIIQGLIEQNSTHPCAVILNFSSRMAEISCQRDFPDFLYSLFRLSLSAKAVYVPEVDLSLYNLIIFLLDKENDFPAWYTLENPRVRSIPVAKPDHEMRRLMADVLLPQLEGWKALSPEKQTEVRNSFVDLTGGMYAREMLTIMQLALAEALPAPEIGEAVRRYQVGVQDNPWAKIDRQKLLKAEGILAQRVIGQEEAVRMTAAILRRCFYNLSGAQFSRYSNRPKGVLFFAGPTGVGKTELAKTITEFIFGSEHNYIRFDMSEFSQEHADQRLVGAPPGYVGYEVGGELTNAIRQRPFSVVLFDEIEKAHPKILDIFLQILDDGRLTSGRGETAYFSESLIIFTSNLGIYEITPTGEKIQRVTPDMPYSEIRKKLIDAIQDHFKYRLGRPEILNRIGENIVVFDFLRPEHARGVLNKMLRNLRLKLEDEHKIQLFIDPYVENKLYEEVCKDLSMGGRGIGNKLEKIFINPLSTLLFELSPSAGDKVYVKDIIQDGNEWRLRGSL